MGGTGVAVVDVVGVLPNIEGEQRPQIGGYWIVGVFVLSDNKFAIGIGREPNPTRTEQRHTFRLEFGFELIETAKGIVDGGGNFTRWRIAFRWCLKLLKIKRMVQNLTGIVEYSAIRFFHNIFECRVFESAAGQSRVQVVDICLQMLAVVVFKSLAANDWRQFVCAVGKLRHQEFSVVLDN